MLLKIDRQDAIKKFTNLPLRHYDPGEDEDVFNYPEVFANYILTLPSKSYKGHIKLLGKEIATLTTNFGFEKLIFLGDEKTAWLYRDHTYEPAKEAQQYLRDNKIGKRFNGAIQVGTNELPTFIKHLCWLVRTNAVLPYIRFTSPEQNFIGDICQYGNLHIAIKTKTDDQLFKEILARRLFEYITEKNCYNKFSKSNSIKGREILI